MQIIKHCFLIEIPPNNWDILGKKYRILKVVKRELGSDLALPLFLGTLGISLWLQSLYFSICKIKKLDQTIFLKPLPV